MSFILKPFSAEELAAEVLEAPGRAGPALRDPPHAFEPEEPIMSIRLPRSRQRLLLVLGLLLAGCGVASLPAPSVAAAATADDAAIRAGLDTLNAAMARRDVPAVMALFDDTDDILLVGSDTGEVFRGRAAVAGFIQALCGLPFVFSFDLPDVIIRHGGRSAWVFADGAMVHTRDNSQATRVPYRFSLAMVKRGHEWRWQLFHGAIPRGE
jgi:ketosteroid isomerase-like protein